MLPKLALTILASLGLFSFSAHADVVYTYQTNFFNPLHDVSKPSAQSPADFFGLTFSSVFALAPNSVYNISLGPSASQISSWSATDSLFGIHLTGINAPISLVPSPGQIEGGTLLACGITCFGGTVVTDQNGHIVKWNLVADGASGDPYLTFISYNTPGLGSIDALGSTPGSNMELQANSLNGPLGIWQSSGEPTGVYVAGVPEPSTWAMMLIGFAGIGLMSYLKSRRLPVSTR